MAHCHYRSVTSPTSGALCFILTINVTVQGRSIALDQLVRDGAVIGGETEVEPDGILGGFRRKAMPSVDNLFHLPIIPAASVGNRRLT